LITFDGTARIIYLDPSQILYTDIEIYSRWLEWVHGGEGALYPAAFEQEGGTPIPGGATPVFTILQNQAGFDWKIQQPSTNEEYTIQGNLISADENEKIFLRPVGFSPSVQIKGSEIAVVGAVLSANEKLWLERIYMSHIHRRTLDLPSQTETVYAADGVTKAMEFDTNSDATEIIPRFAP